MNIENSNIRVSATDLARHLACRYLTGLDLRAARGEIKRIHRHDPSLDVLIERGFRHEAAYLSYLKEQGCDVLTDDSDLDAPSRVQWTINAMRSGVGAITQAGLKHDRWQGRADVLLRVNTPSNLGDWSYEVVDTKLARETRGGTILQLCLYSEIIAGIQGLMPDRMHVVTPGRNFQPETFRPHDFLAYYRFVKSRLETEVSTEQLLAFYPEPVEHCDVCSWWTICNDRRRADDHLSFVAGISKVQINELRRWNVPKLGSLAAVPLPLQQRPERGAPETYVKVREQARLQVEYRTTGRPIRELLPPEPKLGLARLPEPSAGDIFLDFEADPFVEDGGIEYLLGYVTSGEYSATWAFDRTAERRAFESFIDLVTDRQRRYPDLHIYHYSQYETTALKRLMGRYASREDEIDSMLRSGVFVDLHGIVRQALRASVERYSLKDLEIFFGFGRTTDLRDARLSLRNLECALELNEIGNIPEEALNTVESYNREDCISTLRLRDWLESLRQELVAGGAEIQRPPLEPGEPTEAIAAKRIRTQALAARLLHGIPDEPGERTRNQQGQWLLAHMLEWHRREEKAPWWEYFRLRALTDDERLEERCAIGGLEFVTRVGGTDRSPIDRYRFPQQDAQVRDGDQLETSTGPFGKAVSIDAAERTIDVKKRGAMKDTHPRSVFVHSVVTAPELAESLFRLGTWVADHGIDAPGPYRAARDLLLRLPPRGGMSSVLQLDHGILPIQGPPGSGKTYTAARMICDLIRTNKKVGITATSHKVIRKVLEEVLKVAAVTCIQKVSDDWNSPHPAIPETDKNDRVLTALQDGSAQLGAGTAWMWSRPEFAESVDVLFVDEAGQMSLADVLAVSQAATNLVLLGDPRQLEQPIQGTHPPGVDVSALEHVLGGAETMPPDRGLFLAETWRLAPAICAFTSELFYEGRLSPHPGLDRQQLTGPTRFAGSGLWYVPSIHDGNQNSSDEEAALVVQIVHDLLQPGTSWTDMHGETRPLQLSDILIVAPYNAQVFNIASRLPAAHVGTVDKFQGQQAPVVIYSMATSSPEDAPRGMEFLYSLNRFNVATSRARCACILVASPRLFEPDCKTPHQMKLANALCRYREMANTN